jgi:hypothetical protein
VVVVVGAVVVVVVVGGAVVVVVVDTLVVVVVGCADEGTGPRTPRSNGPERPTATRAAAIRTWRLGRIEGSLKIPDCIRTGVGARVGGTHRGKWCGRCGCIGCSEPVTTILLPGRT